MFVVSTVVADSNRSALAVRSWHWSNDDVSRAVPNGRQRGVVARHVHMVQQTVESERNEPLYDELACQWTRNDFGGNILELVCFAIRLQTTLWGKILNHVTEREP